MKTELKMFVLTSLINMCIDTNTTKWREISVYHVQLALKHYKLMKSKIVFFFF